MDKINFDLNGQKGRLDVVLTDLLDNYSRSQVQKLIKDSYVTVNGKVEKTNYKTNGDEKIIVEIPVADEIEIIGQKMDLDIVYEDDYLLVINKAPGIVVHPSKGHGEGTLVNGLVYYLNDNLSNRDSIRPGIVHRLDKDTSGLLVVAKDNLTHRLLSQQIEERKVERNYIALVNGQLDIKQGIIEVPLGRDPHNRLKYHADINGKYALSHYEVIETYKDFSLVKLELKTGRTHQLRVHLEYIGHPIVGDPVYRQGLGSLNTDVSSLTNGQYLHAFRLAFTHPHTGDFLELETKIPERFSELINGQKFK